VAQGVLECMLLGAAVREAEAAAEARGGAP